MGCYALQIYGLALSRNLHTTAFSESCSRPTDDMRSAPVTVTLPMWAALPTDHDRQTIADELNAPVRQHQATNR